MTSVRIRASAIHLLGSSLVAAVCAGIVFLLWYPGVLAVAAGVTSIFVLMLTVDVVMGPLLTLVVFNPNKPELRRDMAVILLLQSAALAYGLHAVFVARPVYEVYNAGRFDLIFANDLNATKLAKVTDPAFKDVPLWGPRVVAAKRPDDAKARNEILFSAIAGGDDLPQLPQYYVPFPQAVNEVRTKLLPLSHLIELNKDRREDVDDTLRRYGARGDRFGYLPLKGRARDVTVIVRSDTGEVEAIVDLAPW